MNMLEDLKHYNDKEKDEFVKRLNEDEEFLASFEQEILVKSFIDPSILTQDWLLDLYIRIMS